MQFDWNSLGPFNVASVLGLTPGGAGGLVTPIDLLALTPGLADFTDSQSLYDYISTAGNPNMNLANESFDFVPGCNGWTVTAAVGAAPEPATLSLARPLFCFSSFIQKSRQA